MEILKFGGTSISSKKSLDAILNILLEYDLNGESVVIVVSALKSVTNQLAQLIKVISSPDLKYEAQFKKIKRYHMDFIRKVFPLDKQLLICDTLNSLENEYDIYLKRINENGDVTARDRDRILAYGELCSSQILQKYLKINGKEFYLLDSRKAIVTDANYGNANINWTLTSKRIRDFFKRNPRNCIVPGFIAATCNGSTTTLGRGGSDYTATIFGTVLKSKRIVKWTDVDGIMSADPKAVINTHSIKELSFNKLLGLTKFGENVLVHPKSLRQLSRAKIPLIIKNTFNMNFPGTLIRNLDEDMHTTVSYHGSCNIISIGDNFRISKSQLKKIFASEGLYFRIKSQKVSSNNSLNYVVSDECLAHISSMYYCANSNSKSCEKTDSLEVLSRDVAIVTLMSEKRNIALEKYKINSLLLIKGIEILDSRDFHRSICFLLSQNDALRALNHIHNHVFHSESSQLTTPYLV